MKFMLEYLPKKEQEKDEVCFNIINRELDYKATRNKKLNYIFSIDLGTIILNKLVLFYKSSMQIFLSIRQKKWQKLAKYARIDKSAYYE